MLTAQGALFDAELALVDTRRTQMNSVVQLYKALGGGWKGIEEQMLATPDSHDDEASEISSEPS
ncbi:MAG: hypothetical protein R3351_06005 [Nitrospirales bacterium]|nr:hypothetical protein [Nitrospirales bacterium]